MFLRLMKAPAMRLRHVSEGGSNNVIDDHLRGECVRLSALAEGDVPEIARWFQDGAFMRLLDAVPARPKTEPELREWLERSRNNDSGYLFAVRPLDGEQLLGYIELDGILWNMAVAWFSIALAPEQRNQGYGYDALRVALRFAFGELNLHRVQLTVFDYNKPAIAVYEKLGFRREGTFREFLQRDGRRYDMLLYGLLRAEWEAGQG